MSIHLNEWINNKYLTKDFIVSTQESLLSTNLVKAIVFDDFLNKNISNKLRESILNIGDNRTFSSNEADEISRNPQFGYNKDNIPGNVNHYHYKGPIFQLLNSFLNSGDFLRYIGIFYGKPVIYQDKWDQNNNGITFQDNYFIDVKGWHTDYETWYGKKKMGNILLYLTPEWNDSYGGCLELGKRLENGKIIAYDRVPPLFNRFVILISERNKSWHKIGNFNKEYHRVAYINQVFPTT